MASTVTWMTWERVAPDRLLIEHPHPTNYARKVSIKIQIPGSFPAAQIKLFAEALEAGVIGYAVDTASIFIHASKKIMEFNIVDGLTFPAQGSPHWQNYIFDCFDYFMIRANKGLKRASKVKLWKSIKKIFDTLMLRGTIPWGTSIPTGFMKNALLANVNSTSPLNADTTRVPVAKNVEDILPKKFLTSMDSYTDGDEFIDLLKQRFTRASEAAIQGCTEYWNNLMATHQLGADMIKTISPEELQSFLDDTTPYRFENHPCNPNKPKGLSLFLAATKHHLTTNNSLTHISFAELRKIPFFTSLLPDRSCSALLNRALDNLAQPFMRTRLVRNEGFYRLLGVLTGRDCAAAAAIFISENPSFTAEGIQHADYLNANGKPYIFTYGETGQKIFGIEKPRASARKISPLPPLSTKIFEDVIKATSILRKILREKEDPSHRKLFITSSYRWIGHPSALGTHLANNRDNTVFTEIQNYLDPVDITKKTFTLSSIRATQGILEYLKTGSFYSTSVLLGNTPIVAQRHYVPGWLAERWARRTARIFNQKLIVLATEGAPWQLSSSDFLEPEQLLSFMSRIVTEAEQKDDALSFMIKSRLSKHLPDSGNFLDSLVQRGLHIKLTPESLGALYVYSATVDEARMDKNLIDKATGLTPQSLIALTQLVRAAASEPEMPSHAEWSVRSHLQGRSHLQLKSTNILAEKYATEMLKSIKTATVMKNDIAGNKHND